jgi:hypothetical protein
MSATGCSSVLFYCLPVGPELPSVVHSDLPWGGGGSRSRLGRGTDESPKWLLRGAAYQVKASTVLSKRHRVDLCGGGAVEQLPPGIVQQSQLRRGHGERAPAAIGTVEHGPDSDGQLVASAPGQRRDPRWVSPTAYSMKFECRVPCSDRKRRSL